jgi:excisionase family DNA binding protein
MNFDKTSKTVKLPSATQSAIDRRLLFDKPIWTIDEVAHFLDYSQGYIYNLVNQKMIPFHQRVRKGRLYFIPSEILEWIKERGFR